jgi:hypothetical protein
MILISSKNRFYCANIYSIFRIISRMGCGELYEGVAVAADMYHVQKVRAFIGPYCSTGKLIKLPSTDSIHIYVEKWMLLQRWQHSGTFQSSVICHHRMHSPTRQSIVLSLELQCELLIRLLKQHRRCYDISDGSGFVY